MQPFYFKYDFEKILLKPCQGFGMGFLRRSKAGQRSTASCRNYCRSFLKAPIYHYLVVKDFSMDLNHYVLGSFEWCKVVCSATHPQSLCQCFCSFYQKVQDFNQFILQLWKKLIQGLLSICCSHVLGFWRLYFTFKHTDCLFFLNVLFRPPVSRAAPQPEKLQKNNVNKKKKLVEVRINIFLISLEVTWLGEIPPCFVARWRAGTITECAHSHAHCSVPREVQPGPALWPRKNPVGDFEWQNLLVDFGTSLSPQTTCLNSYIICRTRNILWPVWTVCNTWSVANWDCSQWAVIVFGTVIKSGFRAPRQ